MAWSLSLILAALFAVLFLFGQQVGERGARVAFSVLVVCMPFIFLPAALVYWPSVGYVAATSGPWGRIYTWWPAFFAFVVLGIATSRTVARKPRVAFITLAVIYALITLYRLFAVHCMDLAPLEHKVGADGICRQSTDWTCGPASAVTLLLHYRIPATEGEMARLALADPLRGVDDVQLALAIREKALPKGYDVTVAESNWQSLRSSQLPVLVVFNLSSHLDHYAVVFHADEEGVLLADPLIGARRVPREEFLLKWRKIVIALQRVAR
ncbi:MAG: cysteine peptidase family C39 domain-containing protein [Candidatus Brocadiia bacterium]